MSGQLNGVGRVHLLSGDHCIHLSVCSPTCPAASHTALPHFNRAFMVSLSAASKALLPSGPFRSLSAPCGGEGTWILTMLGGRITSSSQRDANFMSEGEVRSRGSRASLEAQHPITAYSYAATGKSQSVGTLQEVELHRSVFSVNKRNNQKVETVFEFELESTGGGWRSFIWEHAVDTRRHLSALSRQLCQAEVNLEAGSTLKPLARHREGYRVTDNFPLGPKAKFLRLEGRHRCGQPCTMGWGGGAKTVCNDSELYMLHDACLVYNFILIKSSNDRHLLLSQ